MPSCRRTVSEAFLFVLIAFSLKPFCFFGEAFMVLYNAVSYTVCLAISVLT